MEGGQDGWVRRGAAVQGAAAAGSVPLQSGTCLAVQWWSRRSGVLRLGVRPSWRRHSAQLPCLHICPLLTWSLLTLTMSPPPPPSHMLALGTPRLIPVLRSPAPSPVRPLPRGVAPPPLCGPGYPWIDAIMTQLRQWGWMHHLARHCVACFLTRGDLYVSWENGKDVFEEYLIDQVGAGPVGCAKLGRRGWGVREAWWVDGRGRKDWNW